MDYLDDALRCTRRGCIEPKATKKLCRKHADQLNERMRLKRLSRRNSGFCKKCNTKRIPTHSLCLYHYFSSLAKRYLNDKNKGAILYEKYLAQNKRCFFTDIIIVPGALSIDHLLPQSQYPEFKYNIDNLVFCHLIVNHMKRDYPLKDFIDYCHLVTINKSNIIEGYENARSKIQDSP